jgi:AraC-like DNA-binding protein
MFISEEFALFVVFSYFCGMKPNHPSTDNASQAPSSTGIVFLSSLQELALQPFADPVLHILCLEGSMSFVFQEVHYNVLPDDYVILPNALLASDFHSAPNFKAFIMVLSEGYVAAQALQSNYGITGHISLLRNPVMKLKPDEVAVCKQDMELLRDRMGDARHLFRKEMVAHLLLVHILDLYDIHARRQSATPVSETTGNTLRRFMELLYQGEYIEHRDIDYYASRLCITPHYLSEICKRVSGEPASYWIDRFLMLEIVKLLHQRGLSLTEICYRLHFSSPAYFSRYVRKRTGLSPSEYRKQGFKQ